MKTVYSLLYSFIVCSIIISCKATNQPDSVNDLLQTNENSDRIPVIFDTDANNELDDQHALAYLLFNTKTFDIRGVTTNATFNGGDIQGHMSEAQRVMDLCQADTTIPLLAGANSDFEEIRAQTKNPNYDGKEAISFIIKEARKARDQKLVLLPVGKLTNIALALYLAPDIKDKVRIVWLGSNYPDPGEYNLINDVPSMTYILEQDVPFEMVVCRYGKASGSDAVRVTPLDVITNLKGQGPIVQAVEGRHKGSFTTFGDYAVNLFEHVDLHGNPPARALFDMVAVAILKNESWGERVVIPAPAMVDKNWKNQDSNDRSIIIWENFDKKSILQDFYDAVKNPRLNNQK